MKYLFLTMLVTSLSLGCAPERQVDITLLTSTRDSSLIVDNDYIELTEGEAIGVQVQAVSGEETKATWRIQAKSENTSIVTAADTEDESTFVIVAKRPGSTELRFELRGKDRVYVPITVHPRGDWQETPGVAGASGN